MDFVVFLDYQVYEAQESFLDKYWTFSLEEQKLDAYLVKKYPKGHTEYEDFLINQSNWLARYNYIKPDNNGQIFQKGLVEINFG